MQLLKKKKSNIKINVGTPEIMAVIILKYEHGGFSI